MLKGIHSLAGIRGFCIVCVGFSHFFALDFAGFSMAFFGLTLHNTKTYDSFSGACAIPILDATPHTESTLSRSISSYNAIFYIISFIAIFHLTIQYKKFYSTCKIPHHIATPYPAVKKQPPFLRPIIRLYVWIWTMGRKNPGPHPKSPLYIDRGPPLPLTHPGPRNLHVNRASAAT